MFAPAYIYATKDAAGLDVCLTDQILLKAQYSTTTMLSVNTGLHISPQFREYMKKHNLYLTTASKSSSYKMGFSVCTGIIDADYTGSIFIHINWNKGSYGWMGELVKSINKPFAQLLLHVSKWAGLLKPYQSVDRVDGGEGATTAKLILPAITPVDVLSSAYKKDM